MMVADPSAPYLQENDTKENFLINFAEKTGLLDFSRPTINFAGLLPIPLFSYHAFTFEYKVIIFFISLGSLEVPQNRGQNRKVSVFGILII